MADILIGSNLDLQKNQTKQRVIELLASPPSSPTEAQEYYDTVQHGPYWWNGSAWQPYAGTTPPHATTSTYGLVVLSNTDATSTAVSSTDSRLTDARQPTGSAGGDLSGTYPNPTVATVGGKTASQVATAVNNSHLQNTDTGTTSTTFLIDSGGTGVKIKDNTGTLEVRNAGDSAYANLKCNILYANEIETISSTVINTGDTSILLNADSTTNAGNSDISIVAKRFATDNTTRNDASFKFSESNGYFTFTFPTGNTTNQTNKAAAIYQTTVGDGSTTSFTVTHNLKTSAPAVTARKISTNAQIMVGVTYTSTTALSVTCSPAAATNDLQITVIG